MKFWTPQTLKTRLTVRLILLQLLFLTLFAIIAAIPVAKLSGATLLLDEGTVWAIARDIVRTDEGGLALRSDSEINDLVAQYPAFWFLAADGAGHQVSLGTPPEKMVPIGAELFRFIGGSISDTGDAAAPTAIIRPFEGPTGDLRIITGGGPQFGPASWNLFIANRFFVFFAALLSLSLMAIIPWILRRELRGLENVAKEAESIDVDQRGVRLSEAKLPGEMRALVGAVNDALTRLDDGFIRRQRFLADAAHELRTPIAILQTRIDMLPQTPERQRLMLDVARLSSMADQLLDLQRLDADQSRFRRLNLVDLAAQVTADMAPLAIAGGNEITFDTEAEAVFVVGDAPSLSRALTNLIQNAIAHGGTNGTIGVCVGRDGSMQVSDTGPGVPLEHRSRIFEPFHRVKPLDYGAGLGLNLVQDIVALHNGNVAVSDAPSGGALFAIRIPLAA